MEKVTSIEVSATKERALTFSHLKVCMYMLRTSRTEARFMRDATALAKAGFAVSVVDVENDTARPAEEDMNGICIKHMIVPSWFTSRGSELWFFAKAVQVFFISIYRLLQTQADIYHASELTALPASYIVAKMRRKPLIFEAHEHHLNTPETDVAFWRPLGGLLLRFLSVLLPHCAGVITVSSPIVEEMRNRYHIPEVTLIRSVPTYKVVLKSNRLRQHLNLSAEKKIALYQGGIERNRGLDRLIRAAAFLDKDIVIVIMGQDTDSTRIELEALLAKEGVVDRVKILPAVPYVELLDWTASADLGLIIYAPDYSPNVRMCLPNKLFEYLMAGLPVLASPLEAVAEVINTYDVGRVVPSPEPAEIGAAINSMLSDHAALEQMRQHALEASKHELNWEKESQRLINLYQKILAKRDG